MLKNNRSTQTIKSKNWYQEKWGKYSQTSSKPLFISLESGSYEFEMIYSNNVLKPHKNRLFNRTKTWDKNFHLKGKTDKYNVWSNNCSNTSFVKMLKLIGVRRWVTVTPKFGVRIWTVTPKSFTVVDAVWCKLYLQAFRCIVVLSSLNPIYIHL